MNPKDSIKISALIKLLKVEMLRHGDLDVYVASPAEGGFVSVLADATLIISSVEKGTLGLSILLGDHILSTKPPTS